MAAHILDKGHDIKNETKLLKHITNPKDLAVGEKLFIQKNKDLVMNLDIPSEIDLIRKYSGPEVSQSETAEDGKNGFLKMFPEFK